MIGRLSRLDFDFKLWNVDANVIVEGHEIFVGLKLEIFIFYFFFTGSEGNIWV